jgi:replicative DNA helicase
LNAKQIKVGNNAILLHCIEAEQQLLGACLNSSDAVDLAACIVEPEHFYEPIHGQIFDWLREMRSRAQRTSPTLLIAQLGCLGFTDIVGVPLSVYVARLCAEATTIVNTPDFSRVIRDLWERRQVENVLQGGLELVTFRRKIHLSRGYSTRIKRKTRRVAGGMV